MALRDLVEHLYPGRDGREVRAHPLRGLLEDRSDVDEPGDPLARIEPEGVENAAVEGVPLGDPGGAVAERMGGMEQVHAGRARGQNLLPFGDLDVRLRPRDDADHKRRPGEAVSLEG